MLSGTKVDCLKYYSQINCSLKYFCNMSLKFYRCIEYVKIKMVFQ